MAAQGVHKYPDGEEYKGEWMEGIEHNVLTECYQFLEGILSDFI